MKIKPDFLFSFRLTPRRTFIGILIALFLSLMSTKCSIDNESILKLYNDIRRAVGINFPIDNDILKEIDRQLNERINKTPELLDFKIRGEVDDAINRYNKLIGDDGTVRIAPPKYIEKPIDESVCYTEECKSLGGEMRICAPWVENCN
jgi:hypothetical protein